MLSSKQRIFLKSQIINKFEKPMNQKRSTMTILALSGLTSQITIYDLSYFEPVRIVSELFLSHANYKMTGKTWPKYLSEIRQQSKCFKCFLPQKLN